MKKAEKMRLTALTRDAALGITCDHPLIKDHLEKVASKYSPTNAEQFRSLSEIVWWLIAVDAYQDAMRLLDVQCEVDDDYYWMFHALASSFATRAWLNSKQKNVAEARNDAKTALQWVHRDPNPKEITKSELNAMLGRFDAWLADSGHDHGPIAGLQVLSHALCVLVMYQQFAKAGDKAAKGVAPRDYTNRLNSAIRKLRTRLVDPTGF